MIFDTEALVAAIAAGLRDEFGPDEVLNATQAGQLLGLHANTVARLAKAGEIPGHKYGDTWRFSRRALMAQLRTTHSLPSVAD